MEGFAVLNRVIRKSLIEELVFDQDLEGQKGSSEL